MKAIAMLSLSLAILLGGAHAASGPVVEDERGQRVELARPAQRIVSLAPHITEMLFAIGAGPQVVGAVSYSNYPQAAKRVERVGEYSRIDLERVLAMEPELVVAWGGGNPSHMIQRLRELGLTVYINEPKRLLDIPKALRRLGTLTGHQQQADQLAEQLLQRHRTMVQRYAQSPRVKVFYQIWADPLMTLNGEHIFSDLLHSCGAVNIFAQLPALAATVSPEAVLARDPEVIIVSGMGRADPGQMAYWRRWPELRAVVDENLFYIHPDLVQRSGPRLFDGQEQLCGLIQQARSKRGHHAD